MIVVDHVTKYYGSTAAVRNLDFKIEEGECIGFLGLNGAGKSTTLRLLSCLLLPTSGRISIRGFDVEEQPHDIRKLIGFLPDRPPLYPEMEVGEYLYFAGQLRGMSRAGVRGRVPEVLDTCGLDSVADQRIKTLSHGYKQRVGIAQATVHDPELLILDEPINGLDPVQIVEMREMILRLRGKHTILLSTHILSEVTQTCDRILMLHQGEITDVADVASVGAEMCVEVELQPSEGESRTDRIQSCLEALPDVSRVVVTKTPNGPRLTVYAGADRRAEIAKALVEGGYGLLRLEQKSKGGLEEMFLSMSRRGEA